MLRWCRVHGPKWWSIFKDVWQGDLGSFAGEDESSSINDQTLGCSRRVEVLELSGIYFPFVISLVKETARI